MDKRTWLKIAAGFAFFMALVQFAVSVSTDAAAYFMAPPPLLADPVQLLLVGGAAALILVIFGLYALSGARIIPHLPLLRLGLIGISAIFLLRGLFIILSALVVLGVLPGQLLVQGEISTLVFLAAGLAYAIGTALNWREMQL